jgi:hypothetical protein
VPPGEPRPVAAGNVGGEMLEAEQQRRKGRTPQRKPAGGTDPATRAAAHQEKAKPDDTGRSDEAAARSRPGPGKKG